MEEFIVCFESWPFSKTSHPITRENLKELLCSTRYPLLKIL